MTQVSSWSDELEWDLSAHVLKFLAPAAIWTCISATWWIHFSRQQRCFAGECVGIGVLGKRGASGHQSDDLADW